MKVEVIADKWGLYKSGDELELPTSTALACIKAGVIKSLEDDNEPKKEKFVKPKKEKE